MIIAPEGEFSDDDDGLIRLQQPLSSCGSSFIVLSCCAATPFVWPMLPQTIRGIPNRVIAMVSQEKGGQCLTASTTDNSRCAGFINAKFELISLQIN